MKNHKEMFEALLAGEVLEGGHNGYLIKLSDKGELMAKAYNDVDFNYFHNLRAITDRHEDYYIKPKTININGFEVPEPCRVAPKLDYTEVYLVDFGSLSKYRKVEYISSNYYQYLEEGLVHLTKEAAKLHAKALLSFTKKE